MLRKSLHSLTLPIMAMLLLSGCIFANAVATPNNLATQPVVTGAGPQTGTAECKLMIFGLFAWGDCSVETAMKNGNITELHHVSQKLVGMPIFYAKAYTIVKGE